MLKFGGVFTLLFTLCIALIRVQPYDDSELRAFLTPPEGCPAPCFMGIRPGVTTMEEAVAILGFYEPDEPVSQQTYRDNSMGLAARYTSDSIVWHVSVGDSCSPNYVYSIFSSTNIRLADFLLVAGVPDREIIFHYESSATSTEYIGIYQPEDYALLILSPDTMSSRISMLKKEVWMVFPAEQALRGGTCL